MPTAAPPMAARRDFDARPMRSASGSLTIPGDKSISHRALMLCGIAEGTSQIGGFLASEDCLASLAAMRALGVRIEQSNATQLKVHGVGLRGLRAALDPLDMGNAGTGDPAVHGPPGGAILRFAADRR